MIMWTDFFENRSDFSKEFSQFQSDTSVVLGDSEITIPREGEDAVYVHLSCVIYLRSHHISFSSILLGIQIIRKMACRGQRKKKRRTKGRSSMDPFTWTRQCWPTSKNLSTTVLCRPRMLFGKSAGRDGW